MKKRNSLALAILSSALLVIFGRVAFSQTIPADSLYLGQIPPGNTPIAFNLPVTAGLIAAERITITSDGKEIYYGEQSNAWPPSISRIKCFKYNDTTWQGPFVVFEGFVCPALSVNDSMMYMQKDLSGTAITYSSTRNDTGWSTPVRLLSTNLQTHYFQKTQLDNYYLSSRPGGNDDLCKLIINNADTTIQSLGKPINTAAIENDFYIARDESYIIIFRLSSPYDFFISFNKGNDKWTNPKNLGININTSIFECSPFVTNDNKYMFFTRGWSSYSIYWVRIDSLIDGLMHTNFIPYVNTLIPDQIDTVDHLFNCTIPDSTFIDDDGNNTLTYSATLSNGNPLPSWLSFDSPSRTFSGTPTATGFINIKVMATDTAMVSVSDIFKLTVVAQPVGIDEDHGSIPNILQLYQNYPNPFNPTTTIHYELKQSSKVSLNIYNADGQKIRTLIHQNQSGGTYTVTWNGRNDDGFAVSSGVYLYRLECNGSSLTKKLILIK